MSDRDEGVVFRPTAVGIISERSPSEGPNQIVRIVSRSQVKGRSQCDIT